MNSVLYLVRSYPGILANETIDMVLVSGVFAQPTTVIFMDDGVFQLLEGKDTINRKDTAKKWSALPTYEVENIFVHESSVRERNLETAELPNFVNLATDIEVKHMIRKADCVVND